MSRSQEGAALVEFALVLPMLALLLIGIIETGRYLAFGVRLSNAAHAGAQFGAQNHATARSSGDIQNAACNDSGFSCTSSTPAPGHTAPPDTMLIQSTTFCSPSATPCPNDSYYVQVNTSANFRPLLRFPIFGTSVSMSAQATQQVSP